MQKKFAIASDHAGFSLKQELQNDLGKDFDFVDLGTDSAASVDYPDYAHKMAEFLKDNPEYLGILICGSGIGISITANRHKHIRSALCHNAEIAGLAREHNNANILVLGARFINIAQAKEMLVTFAKTKFTGGRHQERIQKI